jgi:hypothetical protein
MVLEEVPDQLGFHPINLTQSFQKVSYPALIRAKRVSRGRGRHRDVRHSVARRWSGIARPPPGESFLSAEARDEEVA